MSEINTNTVEICLSTDDLFQLKQDLKNASVAGADRVELCAAMHLDGLTPSIEAIKLAHKYFHSGEIMVMLRPRLGDFYYSPNEIQLMNKQIKQIANAGANGIVFGALRRNNSLDTASIQLLSNTGKSLGLKTTFHRAFDALKEPYLALQQLISFRFDHVLTAGVSWGASGGAEQGIAKIVQYVEYAGSEIEVILAGGVSPDNGTLLVNELRESSGRYSLHSYSGVKTGNQVETNKIRQLKQA